MSQVARYAVLGALFLIPFLPLVVANSFFFPFITGKGFAFRILVEVALAGWIVLALMDARYRPRFSWVLALYASLVAWMFIADALAMNAHKAFWSNYERMDGWVTLAHAFALFLVMGAFLAAERKWRAWWSAFIAGSALICAYGLLQVAGLAEIHQGGVRLDATFGNAAYLAAYLLFAIAVTAWRALESAGAWRYAFSALAMLQTLMLFYTATRGAILGFIGGVLVVLVLYALFDRGRARRAAIAAIAGMTLLAGAFFLARDTAFVTENGTLSRLASVSLESGAQRVGIWKMAGEGIAERPVFGWGQEGFNYIFNAHYQPSMYAQEPWFDRAHNVFIDWAVAGGVPAALLFLALLGAAIGGLHARGAETTRAERVILTGLIAAYAFQALFVFDNLFTYVPLAAVLAFAHASCARRVRAMDRMPELAESAAASIAAPVAIALLMATVWFVNIPAMLAANRLVHGLNASDPRQGLALIREAAEAGSFASQEIAEQAVSYANAAAASPAVPEADKAAIAAYARTLMGEQVARYPQDARLRLQYAMALRVSGDYGRAIAEIETARALSPRKQQIYLQQGLLEWGRGNRSAAAALFSAAYALDPSFPELASYAAAGAYLENDAARAREILATAYGTTTVDSDILSYAYYETQRYDDLAALWQARARSGGASEGYQYALALALGGRRDEALAAVDATLASHPETAATARQVRDQILAP